jgi:type IV pilus assembly protein PilM
MSFFSSKSETFLGIDFGMQSIKAVELKLVKDKPQLLNYAYVNVTADKEAPDEYNKDHAKLLKDALDQLLKEMKPLSKQAIVAIPSFNGLVTVVDFPRMSEKEVAEAIKFESRKYIPASLDEVNISWEIIEDKTNKDSDKDNKKNKKDKKDRSKNKYEKSETMRVVLVAAPKSEVKYYDELFKDVNISIATLELESFSLVRSVVGNTKGRFLVVDMGAKTTNIVLVENGIVYVNRSVDVGGVNVTNAIMQSMNISRDRAIELKEGGENLFTGVTKIKFSSLNYIANEIARVLNSQKSDKIESMILCGGSAQLMGLPEYMASITKLPVTLGNALSRVVYDEKKSGYIKEKNGQFAVAIGLALRGTEE